MTLPLLSICLPIYNGRSFIAETLNCIQRQTYDNFELLISVDVSIDDSERIIRKLVNCKNKRIFTQSKRLGWVRNCNFLIEQVRGAYFSILPQDDLIPDDYFAELLETTLADEQIVNCYPAIKTFGNHEGYIYQPSICGTQIERMTDAITNHFNGVSFRGVVRADIPDWAKLLSEQLPDNYAADTLQILQHAAAGCLAARNDVVYQKRYHDGNEHLGWFDWSIPRQMQATRALYAQMRQLALPRCETPEEQVVIEKAVEARVNHFMKFLSDKQKAEDERKVPVVAICK